ncbi:MAG TPA: M14 metallopeptidase family protein [Thermoanaerobaculia bacterium]|nr:M14 metallopeptidase family protein [Thermoanaerobaculia bacterium]
MNRRCAFVLALFVSLAAVAQEPQAPGANAIPSPEQAFGLPMGARFTQHHRILRYFEELTRRTNLITMAPIGESYEGRPLVLATITSPRNHAALATIRANAKALANGEGNVEAIVQQMPVIVWLAFGVHGNESSSAEAAMWVAHTLVSDPNAVRALDNAVIVLDPLENPDGRERYVTWYQRTMGLNANANPDAYEHQEPWPGGRFNHYLIDMNRDWAWMSQRETQARVAAYQEWMPQVFVDFHEMSAQSSYFFPPDAKPINANLPKSVEHWLEVFGRANAAEFSQRGWQFFVGERFDLFYPGYGDSWPALHGAIGMTYEMAGGGRAGTEIEREDGTVLRLADRVQRHYAAAIATVRTAAQNREQLLRYTHQAARTQIDSAKNTFFIVPGSPNFETLLSLLARQGVQIEKLTAPLTVRATRLDREAAESRTFPAGTAVISTKQARGALANTLLEKAAVLDKAFIDEQRAKAEADEPDDFYDLTTWSLPLAMNVEGWIATTPVTATTTPFRVDAPAPFRAGAYGYLADGLEPNLYRLAGRLLEDGIRFNVASGEIDAGERTFARGTIVILKGANEKDLDTRLQTIVNETKIAVTPLETGWLGDTAFGSEKIRHVRDPKIGLVGGPGSDATSFGMLWHTLDIDTPIPHTVLAAESLRNLDLGDYEVLIFPDGNFADRLGKSGVDKVKRWVSEGGTLVAVKGAHAFLREKDVEISKLKLWEPPKAKEGEAADQRYNDFRIPGSAFRTTMNERSFLTFGVTRPPAVLVEGSNAFLPLAHRVDNILTIDAKEPLISGVAWPESLEHIKGSVYVTSEKSGRGQVITFADDPHFRLFWRGTLPIFLNAVLYGPSFAR